MVNLTTAEQLVIGKYANFSVYGFNILLDRVRAPFVVHFYVNYMQCRSEAGAEGSVAPS